jgi:pimeloyl-ACP methyl ester carboxylesterase
LAARSVALTLICDTVGSGLPVLVLHGLFGSSGNWRGVARELAAMHTVISVDLRNRGASPWADSMDCVEMAEDVLQLIDRPGLQRPTVIGHSMGGKVPMALALRRPRRMGRLIVVDIAPVSYADTDPLEAENLADAVARLGVRYVVITSVNRDDLRNGGAAHFATCIRAVRRRSQGTRVEVLTPDFRGRADVALEILCADAPDVMNHNLETVPRLYRQARPGADSEHSLRLLQSFWERRPDVPTKSGLMLGLGETDNEVLDVMRDLRRHEAIAAQARAMGFAHAACGPPVRSSSHADRQAVAASI